MPPSAILPFALGIFLLQGLLLVADEILFHHRREIPRWERLGHPLDTLTVLLPFLWALSFPFSNAVAGTIPFLALSVFSCLFIAKDEWVHARLCGGGEQWLHALLFVLHPLLFFAAWSLWKAGETGWLAVQTAATAAFLLYQIVYWNFWKGARGEGGGPTGPVAPDPVSARSERGR